MIRNGKSERLQSLQVMRGIAAISVVFYHTHLILSLPEYGGLEAMGAAAVRGWLGVNFFFVLSGFIILYAHARDIGQPAALPNYLWRRFIRLYPVYWIFLTIYVVATLGGMGHRELIRGPADILSAYSLFEFIPKPGLPLKVAWTLFYEVRFYLLFAVLLLSRRTGLAVLGLWVAGILARNLGLLALDWDVFSIWNVYFPVGMLACLSLPRLDERLGVWMLGAGLALLAVLAWRIDEPITDYEIQTRGLMLLAIPFAMILTGAVLAERHYRWTLPRWTVLVGEASYSIYLVHSAFLSVFAMLNRKLALGVLPVELVYVVAFILAICGGVVAHLLVERPLLAWLGRFRPGRALTPQPQSGAHV